MKRATFFLGLALATQLIFAFLPLPGRPLRQKTQITGAGIQFETNGWEQALAEAKKQHKLIFVDAYTSWCGPCKLLKETTFKEQSVGEFFNKNFINIAIDMEKGIGVELAKKYQVDAYPTLLITDADGNIITYTKGYIKAEQLIKFGKHGLSSKTNP
jgi:thioredoxin-related protein